MITIEQIKSTTLIQDSAKAWALDTYKGKSNLDYINSALPILGTSTKVEKGESKGYVTNVVYLQPHDKVAPTTLCAWAKINKCFDDCLEDSGHLGMTTGERAKSRRTILFLLDADRFYALLKRDIEKEHKKHGDKLAIRLNGTSDIDFSDFINSMPHIRFYDYSKGIRRLSHPKVSTDRKFPYDVTFSGSAVSDRTMKYTAEAIRNGYKTAIAFNTAHAKGEYRIPSELADFDETDLRFLDGAVVGALKAKGTSKKFRESQNNVPSFFFNERTYRDLKNLIAIGG